jgi:hypothetical protein
MRGTGRLPAIRLRSVGLANAPVRGGKIGKALVLKLKAFAVGLAALFVSGCGYVAAMRTPIVVKENCQAPPEASEFLSKFPLNPAAVD